MKTVPLIAAALAAATVATTPAFAESVTVEYSDLDLSTEAGQATLESRLDDAARQVCGIDEQRTGTRMGSSGARKCYQDARKQFGEQFAGLLRKGSKGG